MFYSEGGLVEIAEIETLLEVVLQVRFLIMSTYICRYNALSMMSRPTGTELMRLLSMCVKLSFTRPHKFPALPSMCEMAKGC